MERLAWKGQIRPGYKSEYIKRHDEIWPEMVDVLKQAGICNYTIFMTGNKLFGYYECENGIVYAERIQAESPIVDKWNEYTFKSENPEEPAKFYVSSCPAHCTYPTRHIDITKAKKVPFGSIEECNKRVINQYIHPEVMQSCQLAMGLTQLEVGSNWNTMPCHTHDRRMEVYLYLDMNENDVVFHMMGEPTETRHIIMHNEEAVISPSWSIHSGVGTRNYSFIWAMCGENQEFTDMDFIETKDLR